MKRVLLLTIVMFGNTAAQESVEPEPFLVSGCGPWGYYQTISGDYRDRGGYVGLQWVSSDRGVVVTYNAFPIGWVWTGEERRFDLATPINLVAAMAAYRIDKARTGRDGLEYFSLVKALLLAPNSVAAARVYRSIYMGGGFRTNYSIPLKSGGTDRGVIIWPSIAVGSWTTWRDFTSNSERYPGFAGATLMLARPVFWNFDGDNRVGDWTLSFRLFAPFDPG